MLKLKSCSMFCLLALWLALVTGCGGGSDQSEAVFRDAISQAANVHLTISASIVSPAATSKDLEMAPIYSYEIRNQDDNSLIATVFVHRGGTCLTDDLYNDMKELTEMLGAAGASGVRDQELAGRGQMLLLELGRRAINVHPSTIFTTEDGAWDIEVLVHDDMIDKVDSSALATEINRQLQGGKNSGGCC